MIRTTLTLSELQDQGIYLSLQLPIISNIVKALMANHHVVISKPMMILGLFLRLTNKLCLIWLKLKLEDLRKSLLIMKMLNFKDSTKLRLKKKLNPS